jgi:hypothetical protein
LIEHLLKLADADDGRPRRRWISSTDVARRALQEGLTPTVLSELKLPLAYPCNLDPRLDDDWFPTSGHAYGHDL